MPEGFLAADPREPKGLGRPSTKQSKRDSARYRFYAGFSASFVRDVILDTVRSGGTILDPWNGAGTTTSVAAELGYRSVGVDINPAMIAVARARLGDGLAWQEVVDCLPDRWRADDARTSVLTRWLTPRSASILRGFERTLLQNLGVEPDSWAFDSPASLTSAQALAAVVVGAVTREIVGRFQTSNPTWIRLRISPDDRVDVSAADVRRLLREYVAKGPPVSLRGSRARPALTLGNSELVDLGQSRFDLVLTSPPYCTRIDYVVATLPELAILGIRDWKAVEELRIEMLGGPSRQGGATEAEMGRLCDEVASFLDVVRAHSSKAASAYYSRFYETYFCRYTNALQRIADSMKVGGTAVLVVQDSHFKDVQVRLAEYTKRQMELAGLRVVDDWSVPVPNPKALNPATRRYRANSATHETVVICKKEPLQ